MALQAVDTLIIHALVVTQDAQRRILTDAAIAVRDGRIVALGDTRALQARFSPAETIDASDWAIFPGLINTHTHLFQVGTKGLGEDMAVQSWVEVVTAPTAIHISPEEMYLFCLTGCMEQIHCGVTTLVDMSYAAHSFALHEQNIRAMRDSGLRGRYSTIISDFGEEYGVLPDLIKPIDTFLDEYARLQRRFPAEDRMAVWMAIGAPWTVSDHGLKAALAYATEMGMPTIMHINENAVDNELSQARTGKNIVPYLADIGFLRPDLLAIHCVVTDVTDIALYAAHDVKISYNPVSNMYLGSGVPPIIDMARAGLTIGLGTDGAGSNNSQDMLETLKVAALLQKVSARDASVVTAQQILDWATRDAARALGLDAEIGALEVGKRADLFALAPNTAKIVPVHDPLATLVYSSGEENIVMTMAGGKILLRDGVIQHLDEQSVLTRCQAAAMTLADRCGSNARLTRAWRPRRRD